jgi:hypothetical protein
MRLTQPMFLSFLPFKNQKPDLSKLGSETYTRKMKTPLFHNCIRKVCALVAATLILPTLAYAQNNQGDDQGNGGPGVPNGTYAFTNSGWVPVHPDQHPVVDGQVPIAGAGRVTFFANGTLSGVSGFTAGGEVFSVTQAGTFTPNGDGSFSETVIITSINPPFQSTVHLFLYPSPDGNTIGFFGTDPGETTNGVLTRH